MFSRECNECNNLSKTLHEREANITTYKNNLFELKLKIIQSNDLINNYINYKKENENLKKEVAIAKSQSETGKISHINYEVINFFNCNFIKLINIFTKNFSLFYSLLLF